MYDPAKFGELPENPILRCLETKRFFMRPLTVDDASEKYRDWVNDPEVNKYTQARHTPQTIESIRNFISSHDNRHLFLWGIFPRDELDCHIGCQTLKVDWRHRVAMMGVMIGDKTYWGKNVAFEVRAKALDFAFLELGLHKVRGGGLSTNYMNVYNYQKQGWAMEGVEKEQCIVDGRRVDFLRISMFRDDWLKRKTVATKEDDPN